MNILDWIIVGVLLFYVISGIRAGFILKVGSLLGLILGIIIAGRNYQIVSNWFGGSFVGYRGIYSYHDAGLGDCGFIAMIVNKIYNFAAIIPDLNLSTESGARLLDCSRDAFFSGLFLSSLWNLESRSVRHSRALSESKLHTPIVSIGKWFGGLLPDAVRPSNMDFNRILNSAATDEIQNEIQKQVQDLQ